MGIDSGYETSQKISTKLQNVQCEMCHGPGEKHIEDPENKKAIVSKPKKEYCLQCHDQIHSNMREYNYPAYYEKIKHSSAN